MGLGVAGLHVAGWGGLLLYGQGRPALLALGALAYTFGLRHAFDVDHIAAIDNVTRKLLHEGERPMGVGFFFSLGHASVVFGLAAAVGAGVKWAVDNVVVGGHLRSVGGVIGTLVSGGFLLGIGVLNLIVLMEVWRGRRQGAEVGVGTGLMTRVFGRWLRWVKASWQMYAVGFLFGLGFDTASEVGLLAVAGGAAAKGLALGTVLCLPVVFAAGMTLMDTADGAFMAKAYSWAGTSGQRKAFYNLLMTGLSAGAALVVGGMEVAQAAVSVLGLKGGAAKVIANFSLTGWAGYVLVGMFLAAWVGALVIYKAKRMEAA